MVLFKWNKKQILTLINFFKNFSNDSYNLLGRWCHKGVPNCNESVIDKKIDFALLDNSLCTKVTKVTKVTNVTKVTKSEELNKNKKNDDESKK